MGAVVARVRGELGHSQGDVAKALGWNQSQVSRLEAGRALAFDEVDGLARALDTTTVALVRLVERAEAFANQQPAKLDAAGMRALAVYAVAATWRKR